MGKSAIEAKETRNRIFFIVKVILYFLLTIISEYWDMPETLFFARVSNLFSALSFLLAGNIIISLGRIFLVRFYLRKKRADPLHSNFVLGVNRIAGVLNVIIFLITLMILFDIRPLEFLSSITIVAAAIALLSKDYITNMINGLIIMFSDQITLGDHIKIGEIKGKILDITLLNVVLLNEDDDVVMIPNSLILSSQVINHSRQNIRKLTFEFEIKLLPTLNVNEMEAKLRTVVNQFGSQISPDSFVLKTLSIQKDAVKLKLQVQLNTTGRAVEKNIRRKINQSIIALSSENQ
ncbi:mechanosensitive ion channel family protein [Negadavirga shengliensis]|uniref:Mechanosensitive ion channel family protein n=1 Tax=Negadavirga shengliensis TaxID=1389218 RepID=A0ABV9TAC3_9BACT